MRTKHHAKKLAKALTDSGIPSVDLHGNLSQVARDRNLAAFSAGDVRVLVATDVAARGVHVDDIELVIHVDPPAEHKAYLHRSGRTARAGSAGDVVTIMLPAQRKDTEALLRKAAIAVTPQRVNANSPAVITLTGDVAAYVKPLPRTEQPQRGQSQGGRSQGANAQRKRVNRDERDGRSTGGRDGGRDGARAGRTGDAATAGAPRRDRSGRPAASGSGAARSGGQGSGQGRSGGQGGGAGRSGGLQVGGLVRGSSSSSSAGGGARRSAPRRAQG